MNTTTAAVNSSALLFLRGALLLFSSPCLFLSNSRVFHLGAGLLQGSALLFGFGLQFLQVALDAALLAQVVLAGLIGVIGRSLSEKGAGSAAPRLALRK